MTSELQMFVLVRLTVNAPIVRSQTLVIQRIRGYLYNEMRYINLRFTYLLT